MKRRELHLPLTCALIGVLLAICWGMVNRQSNSDRTRVYIEESLPLAIAGLACGAIVGWVLQRAVTTWPALAYVFEAVLIPALAASIAGPIGWLARDSYVDWSGESAILRASAWGAGAGLALYVVTRAYWLMRRTKAAAGPVDGTVR
jgi:hypothetical protein